VYTGYHRIQLFLATGSCEGKKRVRHYLPG
jgi:hypothetical protein